MSREPKRKPKRRSKREPQRYFAGKDDEIFRNDAVARNYANQLVEIFEQAVKENDTDTMYLALGDLINHEERMGSHRTQANMMKDYESFYAFARSERHFKEAYDKCDPEGKHVREVYNRAREKRGEKRIE